MAAGLWLLGFGQTWAAPISVRVDDESMRARLAVDPDIVLAAQGADVEVRTRPDDAAPVRPTLVFLDEGSAKRPLTVLPAPGALAPAEIVTWAGPADHPLARLPWRAAPRAAVRRVTAPPGFSVLVKAGADPLLLEGTVAGVRVLLWTAPVSARPNRDLMAWPLIGYTLHAAVVTLAGRSVEPLSQWEAAPLPGRRSALVITAVLLLIWPVVLLLFRRARRAPPADPALVARYAAPSPAQPARNTTAGASLWTTPGFARPLAGFFVFLASTLLLLAPYYGLVTVLIPNRVQPFPQAAGMWDSVGELVLIVFYLFDFGTETACIRFFAAHRRSDPQRALRYAQLYLWWQILSGLLQLTALALVVFSGPFRNGPYAYVGFFLLLHALGQFPGFNFVCSVLLQGTQRFDFVSLAEVVDHRVLRVIIPIPFILVGRAWGADHPAYGQVFGAVIGLGAGGLASYWLSFAFALVLCRRAGLPLGPLFGASFTRTEIRDFFAFGWRAIPGQLAYNAARSVEIILIASLLHNYTEWLGIWGLLQMRFAFLAILSYRFFNSGVPVFAEALEEHKRSYAQYIVARYLQFAFLWSAVLFAVLAGLGPTFIRVALDPQWHRAAEFVAVAAFAAALGCPGWVADALQRGANRPLLYSLIVAGEQATRLLLFAILVPKLQFVGLFAAITLSLTLKTVVTWYLSHRLILRLRLSLWQSVGAPLVAGLLLFVALKALVGLAAPSSSAGGQVLFYGGAFGSFLASFFLLALLGGLDEDGLGEIDRASRMSGVLRPMAALFFAAARAGAHLSPWHGRFVQPAANDAHRETTELHAQSAPASNMGA